MGQTEHPFGVYRHFSFAAKFLHIALRGCEKTETARYFTHSASKIDPALALSVVSVKLRTFDFPSLTLKSFSRSLVGGLLQLVQAIHVQVTTRAPFRARDVTQPGCHKH